VTLLHVSVGCCFYAHSAQHPERSILPSPFPSCSSTTLTPSTSTMLPRQSSLSRSSSSHKKPSLLRRNTVSVSSTSLTKSEMLDPDQKKQQAVAAAQRAFGADAVRRIHGSQSSSNMPPRLSERNLNQLPLRRPHFSEGSVTITRSTPASASTVASSNYGYSQAPSSVTDGSAHRQRFDDEDTEADDYELTVVRRRESMRWHQENMTSVRNSRQDTNARKAEVDSYIIPNYSPPRLDASTPSSFRRIRKTKSAFAVSRTLLPSDQDVSSVMYGDGSPQKGNSRKSMSFLRGGTEFMGEGRSRERRSYYMESSQRKTCPPIVPPEITAIYKGKNEKGEWGAVRFKKKARKVFGSMRRALGMGCGIDTVSMGSIPEQHVTSSRMHFRDYVTPEEANTESYTAPGKFGAKEKPKIRSNYVISKAPTLHLVSSQEMIRSDIGSISDMSPPVSAGVKRKVSPASMATVSTGTWNSTATSRMSARTLRGNTLDGTLEGGRASSTPGGDDEIYFRPPQRRERLNVDVRRVYSALVKRFPPEEQPALVKHSPDTGYYMTPGIGLLPEEEGVFQQKMAPSSLERRRSNVSIPSRAAFKQAPAPRPTAPMEPMEAEYEYEAESPPPPVPKIPKTWLEPGSSEGPDMQHNQRKGLNSTGYKSNSVKSNNRTSKSPTYLIPHTPPKPNVATKSSFARELERLPAAQSMEEEGNSSVDTFSTSTDAALSACHLQMLRNRRSTPGKFISNENLRKTPVVPKRPAHLEAGEGIRRSRSVLEYRDSKAQVFPERIRTPIGYDRPLSQNLLFRTGLRSIDANALPPIVGSHEPPLVITKKASRISLGGRVSRMSTRECDVGLAVARQFGPVAGQRLDAAGNYGRRMRDEYDSVN
jgi:hypothetical protein